MSLLTFLQSVPAEGLTTGGWFFLIISWAFVISFTVYCFYRVLSTPETKD